MNTMETKAFQEKPIEDGGGSYDTSNEYSMNILHKFNHQVLLQQCLYWQMAFKCLENIESSATAQLKKQTSDRNVRCERTTLLLAKEKGKNHMDMFTANIYVVTHTYCHVKGNV